MKTIIIDCSGDVILEDALVMRIVQHLQDAGHSVDHTNYYNNSVAMISTIAKEIADPIPAETVPQDIPSVELPAEPTVAVELPPAEVVAQIDPQAEPNPATLKIAQVSIMNLSSLLTISATLDPSGTDSFLYVSNIQPQGDTVCFNFCDTFFRYPTCTVSPDGKPGIMASARLLGGYNLIPLTLYLCEVGQSTGSYAVFGGDAACRALEELNTLNPTSTS